MFGNTNLANNFVKDLQNKTDSRVLGWVNDMHNALNRDKINLKELDTLVKALEHMNADAREDYINTLLYPETVFNRKVPTLFPIPSTTFQMHLVSANLQPNVSGNIAFTWNPVFLQDKSVAENTTFFVNKDASLTGASGGSTLKFLPQPLLYNQIPAGLYGSYRIVSASVVISYIGRMDIVSGVIGVGIGLNNSGVGIPQAVTSTNGDKASDTFVNFLQVDNLLYSERSQAANGARAIYFPIDDRYTNFLSVYNTTTEDDNPGKTLANCYATGFYIAGYGQNLPTGASCLRFDFYINVEAIVTPAFNNFIPQSTVTTSSIDVIQAANMLTQKNSDKLLTASSDIPGTSENDISAGNLLSKLSKDEMLPNIDVIKKMNYGNNYY